MLINQAELCMILGICKHSAKKYRKLGYFKPVEIRGRMYLYDHEDVIKRFEYFVARFPVREWDFLFPDEFEEKMKAHRKQGKGHMKRYDK